MLQPISYSLVFNLAVLAVMGALCFVKADPALFLATVVVLPHITQRFGYGASDDEDSDDREPGIGFLANPR